MQRISGAKIVEDFRIVINSLYEHQKYEENEKIVEEFHKEMKTMGGDLKSFVKVTTRSPKQAPETKTYEIDDVVVNGINLPEDVETFEVSVDVYSKVKVDNVISSGIKTLFKSMLFIMSENVKVLKEVSAPKGIRIVRSKALFSAKTGDRIRFGKEHKLEL